ncbi:SGNH/GDSL hydrolase family protein [Nocardia caishijiensis]|uniref:Lysophospholipase L1-like esterase n=1 Tax=Nocardia caishijiensis TaxID=184756 RepID=A0ABQ6YL44_9NOCA|nr:SGNH/GDSL hydrolase family protein [Nocardia caishijiensis]KAF0846505.1 lysophospholipase L1-like esterase [Nocardia caishijiensis]
MIARFVLAVLAAVLLTGCGTAERNPAPEIDVVVTLGDSLTEGYLASQGQRYPDQLGRALAPVRVVEAGSNGNRLLTDSPRFGDSALARFDRDVLGLPGVDAVVVLIGTNDIGLAGDVGPDGVRTAPVTAEQLVEGYRALIDRAHAAKVRVIGATLPPFGGSPYDAPHREQLRTQVNDWIRTGGGFDAVVDLDRALAAPTDTTRLAERFDSGDHLHPNDSGHQEMAAVIAEADVL